MQPEAAAKPVAQFMTTYMLGDDMYDESFTFDAPNGEFLGECGVSSSDIIGVGEPKRFLLLIFGYLTKMTFKRLPKWS